MFPFLSAFDAQLIYHIYLLDATPDEPAAWPDGPTVVRPDALKLGGWCGVSHSGIDEHEVRIVSDRELKPASLAVRAATALDIADVDVPCVEWSTAPQVLPSAILAGAGDRTERPDPKVVEICEYERISRRDRQREVEPAMALVRCRARVPRHTAGSF